MAVLEGKNCATGQRGTGFYDCLVKLGVPDGFIKVPKTWSIPRTGGDVLNSDYIKARIKNLEFTPFVQSFGFAPQNEDNVYQTSDSTGKINKVRSGLPQMDFTFQKGYAWHAAAWTHSTFDTHDTVLVWKNNVFGFGISSDGLNLIGVETGLIDVMTRQDNDGSGAEETTTIKIQLTDADQYNSGMALIEGNNNSLAIRDIKGYLDVEFIGSFTAANTASFQVKQTGNRQITIGGLVDAANQYQFASSGGQTLTGSVYNTATDAYDYTFSAPLVAGDVVSLKLFDNTDTTDVIELASTLYKGETGNVTVA